MSSGASPPDRQNLQDEAKILPKDDFAARRSVRRRRVLYLHGYDPVSTERYRRLLARAGADRAGAPPVITPVGALSDVSEGWRIATDMDGAKTETVFEVLRYEDIVGQWRTRSSAGRILSGLSSWLGFVFSGGFRRLMKTSRRPAWLSLYPILVMAVFVIGGVWVGGVAGEGVTSVGAPDWAIPAGRALGALLGLWATTWAEPALLIHRMLSLYDFLFRVAADKAPAGRLDMRAEMFAKRIADCVGTARAKGVDEILIVGHSLGALMAIKSLARAMKQDVDLTGAGAKVSLLTLGSLTGYVACRGGAGAEIFDDEISTVASDPDLTWVDISASRDWFGLGPVDPLLMMDDPPVDARSPKMISARLGKAEPDPSEKRSRLRPMSLHIRFLAAPDKDGGFDFYRIAAGPQSLAERYEGRKNAAKAKVLA